MKKIGLLSDTHSYLDPKIEKYFKDVDEIWHAGDIGDISVMDELNKIAPAKAVYGNIDNAEIRSEYPLNLRFKCEEVDVWITHIGGKPYKYNQFTRDEMKNNPPDLFICGHSHILLAQYDKTAQCLCLNPGACGYKGFHSIKTIMRFTIDGKNIKDMEVIELGTRV